MRSARPSASAVLPTPGSPTSSGLFLRRRQSTWIIRSSSSRRPISGSIFPSAARAIEIGGVGLERIRRRRCFALSLTRLRGHRLALGAVRDDAKQRQPVDALAAQEVGGVALFLLQHEHQQAARVHVLGAGHRRMDDRLLDDPIEARRRLRLRRVRRRNRREGFRQHLVHLPPERFEIDAAHRQHVAAVLFVGNRAQQVLERHGVVTPLGGQAEGALDRLERFGRERDRRLCHY